MTNNSRMLPSNVRSVRRRDWAAGRFEGSTSRIACGKDAGRKAARPTRSSSARQGIAQATAVFANTEKKEMDSAFAMDAPTTMPTPTIDVLM